MATFSRNLQLFSYSLACLEVFCICALYTHQSLFYAPTPSRLELNSGPHTGWAGKCSTAEPEPTLHLSWKADFCFKHSFSLNSRCLLQSFCLEVRSHHVMQTRFKPVIQGTQVIHTLHTSSISAAIFCASRTVLQMHSFISLYKLFKMSKPKSDVVLGNVGFFFFLRPLKHKQNRRIGKWVYVLLK